MKRLILSLALSLCAPASAFAQDAADFLLSYISYQSFNGGYSGTALRVRNTCRGSVRAPQRKVYSLSLFAPDEWEFGAANPVYILTTARKVAVGFQDKINSDRFEVSHRQRGKDKKQDTHVYRFAWSEEWDLLFTHHHVTRRADGKRCSVQYLGKLF